MGLATAPVALRRDVFTYTHFPMIVGIVLFAFAMKKIIGHVGDELGSVAAFALCGGSTPALAALAIVTAVWLGLDTYELVWRRTNG